MTHYLRPFLNNKRTKQHENKHFSINYCTFLANCLVKSIISNNFAASKQKDDSMNRFFAAYYYFYFYFQNK